MAVLHVPHVRCEHGASTMVTSPGHATNPDGGRCCRCCLCSKPPLLFTISKPTPCFFWVWPLIWGRSLLALPGPFAQSLLAPSLPRAMENFCDFLTFLQLFGSEEGAGAAHKHVYV